MKSRLDFSNFLVHFTKNKQPVGIKDLNNPIVDKGKGMALKRLFLTLLTAFCILPSFAQKVTTARIDSLLQVNNAWLEQIEVSNSLKQRYKLYPTENIYTLLQLDTKTGMIEQVQWSLNSDEEGSVTINGDDLTYGLGYGSGSFELYPTKNLYQFILLNKTTGMKWHVQWGMKSSERWIRRIYKLN